LEFSVEKDLTDCNQPLFEIQNIPLISLP